jgi:hypothetical protein
MHIGPLENDMKAAGLVVALLTIVIGVLGLVSPDSVMTARRLYFATPAGLVTAAGVRLAMGIVVILVAPRSRTPRTLRALGALKCLQAVSATLLGPNGRERSSNGKRRMPPFSALVR